MKKYRWLFSSAIAVALGLSAACALSAANAASVGSEAPDIEYEVVFAGPEDPETDWYSLKDKVVVLEFWGTG